MNSAPLPSLCNSLCTQWELNKYLMMALNLGSGQLFPALTLRAPQGRSGGGVATAGGWGWGGMGGVFSLPARRCGDAAAPGSCSVSHALLWEGQFSCKPSLVPSQHAGHFMEAPLCPEQHSGKASGQTG